MQKCVIRHMQTAKALDQPAHLQSEQGLHCLLTKSLSTTEYMESKGLADTLHMHSMI